MTNAYERSQNMRADHVRHMADWEPASFIRGYVLAGETGAECEDHATAAIYERRAKMIRAIYDYRFPDRSWDVDWDLFSRE